MRNTILTTAATALIITSALTTADASKFIYRHTLTTIASAAPQKPETPETPVTPETPEVPEIPEPNGVLITSGSPTLSHFDADGNSEISAGDRLTVSMTVRNTSSYPVRTLDHDFKAGIKVGRDPVMFFPHTYDSGAISPVTCPLPIAVGAQATCAASIVVTTPMLPAPGAANRVVYEVRGYSVFDGVSKPSAMMYIGRRDPSDPTISNITVAAPAKTLATSTYTVSFDVSYTGWDLADMRLGAEFYADERFIVVSGSHQRANVCTSLSSSSWRCTVPFKLDTSYYNSIFNGKTTAQISAKATVSFTPDNYTASAANVVTTTK